MQNNTIYSSHPTFQLVATWMSIIPLAYFASRGQLWFQHSADNESMADLLGSVASIDRISQLITAIIVMTAILLLFFPTIPQLIDVCRRNKIFVALSALAMASCLWSQFPVKSLENALFLSINTLFAFYLFRRFDQQQRIELLYLFGWICLLFSLVLSVFFPAYGLDSALGTDTWRGIYINKNACAMETTFLLSLAFYLPVKSLLHKIFRVFYIVLSVLLIIMSQSRTGWILLFCLSVYVIVIKIIQQIAPKDRVIAVVLGTVFLSLIVFVTISHLEQIFYFLGKDPTLTGRTDIWKAVATSAMKRPILGYGYMGFFRGLQGENANVGMLVGRNVSASHNGFLDVWCNLGAVGLGLVLWSLLKAAKNASVCYFSKNSSYLCWCTCIVFLIIVTNIDEKAMMVPNDLLWVLYILAYVGLSDGARRIRLERFYV